MKLIPVREGTLGQLTKANSLDVAQLDLKSPGTQTFSVCVGVAFKNGMLTALNVVWSIAETSYVPGHGVIMSLGNLCTFMVNTDQNSSLLWCNMP